MNILGAIFSGSYIGVVKEYIDKIFKHEAKLFNHLEDEFDVILKKKDGEIHIYIYSHKEKQWLREMSDKEAEKILTS